MGTTYTLTPALQNVPNSYDYLGMIVGLPRILGEDNASYRKRMLDVYVNRGGSNYRGLLNGITRELGFVFYDAMTIYESAGDTLSPRVIVEDSQISLYSNWNLVSDDISPNALDGEVIDIYSKSGGAYTMGELVNTINTTTYFTASLANGVDPGTLSTCLLKQDSRTWIQSEDLESVKRNKLDYTNIVPGTLTFSSFGNSVFQTQVATEASVDGAGDYYIDYANGYVITYSTVPPNTTCRYMYDILPITLKASPVILHDLGDSNFRSKIFEQVLTESGEYTEGLPLNDAIDLIHELLIARGVLWGA